MTQYYVKVSTDLLESLDPALLPDGFRFVMRWGPRGTQSECWLVDDFHASPEFEGHLVDICMSRDYDANQVVIESRSILGASGLD